MNASSPGLVRGPLGCRRLAPSNNARRVIEDMHTGAITIEILDDLGKTRQRSRTESPGDCARMVDDTPEDPLSAHGKTHLTMETGRNGDNTYRKFCRNALRLLKLFPYRTPRGVRKRYTYF